MTIATNPVDALIEYVAGRGDFATIFRLMAVAEEEILRAKAAHPERADALHDSFKYLSPGQTSIYPRTETLYRAHVREILERVAAGENEKDLALGTKAEVVSVLVRTSLDAPLVRDAASLYVEIFIDLFGPTDVVTAKDIIYSHRDAGPELLAEMKRHCAQPRKTGAK